VHTNEEENQEAKGTAQKHSKLFAIREDETDKLARFLSYLRDRHYNLRQRLHHNNSLTHGRLPFNTVHHTGKKTLIRQLATECLVKFPIEKIHLE